MCRKGSQQWRKIMMGMYHYSNTERINSDLPILKESKGPKNEITNLHLDILYDVISYATGLKQYLLHYDNLELVFDNGHTSSINSSGTPQAAQVLNLLNVFWCGYLKHTPCNAIHIFSHTIIHPTTPWPYTGRQFKKHSFDRWSAFTFSPGKTGIAIPMVWFWE